MVLVMLALVPATSWGLYLYGWPAIILFVVTLGSAIVFEVISLLIAGKPIVSYDVDGAREVVLPGETGYLLPPQSVEELATAICELAGDAELRDRLGRTGRERFTKQFRHQTMTAQIREVYQSVLNTGTHSGVT